MQTSPIHKGESSIKQFCINKGNHHFKHIAKIIIVR